MSLDFDMTKVDPEVKFEMVDGEKVRSLRTQAMIFSSMVVGLPDITEKNWREWYTRLHIMEKITGSSCLRDGDGNTVFTTPQDVKDHIGLHTNVMFSKTEFWQRVRKTLEYSAKDALWDYDKEQRVSEKIQEELADESA